LPAIEAATVATNGSGSKSGRSNRIQAKRWESSVGRPEIQKFVGALHGQRAKKGVFITTSTVSTDAQTYAASLSDPRVVLVDGPQ
jgi:restriction system protein